LNAAFVPQLVETPRDGERGFRAEIALKDFAVVADSPNDVSRPGVCQPDLCDEISSCPDQPFDLRLLGP
jgi:hypothetical protein